MFHREEKLKNNYFSIGEAAKRSNISRRTLRYYEKLELIEPTFVDSNGYRYYSPEKILKLTIIKYLKLMDFTLEEIKQQLSDPDYDSMIKSFDTILDRCDAQIDEIFCRKKIVSDWKKLLEEACVVFSMKMNTVNIKYFNDTDLIKYPIHFNFDYKSAILDWGFSNFIEEEANKITGPVKFYFKDIKERLQLEDERKSIRAKYVQRALKPIRDEVKFQLKAGMYATKYHIGAHKSLNKTYRDLLEWEKTSAYQLTGPVLERFVTDYWSTFEEEKYVTEIIAAIKRKV